MIQQQEKATHSLPWVATILIFVGICIAVPFIRVPFLHGIYDIFLAPAAAFAWKSVLGCSAVLYLSLEDCVLLTELLSEKGYCRRHKITSEQFWRLSRDDWDPLLRVFCDSKHPKRNLRLFLVSQLLLVIWAVGLFT